MRCFMLSIAGILLFGAAVVIADAGKPNLSGTWKLGQAQTESAQTNQDVLLVIEEKDQNIHMEETRGPKPQG